MCRTCGEVKSVSEFLAGPRYSLGYKPDCRGCANAGLRQRYAADPAVRESCRSARERVSPDQRRQYRNNWKARNRDRVNADTNARRRRLRLQMPPWVDRREIRAIYALCPPGYEVDHIIPLRGEHVSGLHVPWNLQYLPKEENRRKGNRL
jgi:5-methylcytosine-specific restriction endonuclease McrA